MRPARESGVVLRVRDHEEGEEQEARRSRAGGAGSPAARPARARGRTRAPRRTARKAHVTSLRAARFTTSPPRQASRNAKTAALPHWPGRDPDLAGDQHHRDEPKFVGLKTCLPRTRSTNLLAMATTAASTASAEGVRCAAAGRATGRRSARSCGSKRGSRRARCGPLGQERRREDGHRAARRDVEAEPRHAVDEQARQRGDLVQAGIEARRGPERHRAPREAAGVSRVSRGWRCRRRR